MNPKISIVINNYNYAAFVGDSIASALHQNYSNVEVICVDDGSIDNSQEVIRRYPQITSIFCEENRGQATAARVGLERSTGHIIVFLDSDDVLFSDACAKIAANWSPGMTMLQYKLKKFSSGSPDLGAIPKYDFSDAPLEELKRYGIFPATPTSGNAFDQEYARNILQGLPDFLPIDTSLIFTAPLLGPVKSINQCLGGYRLHGANMSLVSGPTIDKIYTKVLAERTASQLIESVAREARVDLRIPPLLDAFYWRNELLLFICDLGSRDYSPHRIARRMMRKFSTQPRIPFYSRIKNLALALAFLIAPSVATRLVAPFVRGKLRQAPHSLE
jgi:glycosyltransferase involved in cell wall biosynthesis